jgi:hypothetical protein
MNLQMQAVVVGNIQRALSNRLAGKMPLTKDDHRKAVLLLEQMTGEKIMPPSGRVTDKVCQHALEIADSFMWQIDNHYAEAQAQFQESVAAYNSGLGD